MTQVPISLCLAYLAMLPRLDAQAQLDGARMARIAGAEAEQFGQFERELERAANPDRRRAPAAKLSSETLGAMGFGIQMVDAEGKPVAA